MLLIVGVLYLAALAAGRCCAAFGIPRVTGYLLVGLAAGPSLGDFLPAPVLLTRERLQTLTPVYDIILGLIVFTIGGSFSLPAMRRIGAKLWRISALEIGATALLVGLGSISLGVSPLAAGFLAAIAVTTAPAATQMVMREYESEGPLTDLILPLIGINNLVAIIAFILLKHHGLAPQTSLLAESSRLGAPFVLGGALGLGIALMDQRLTRRVERQIMVLAAIAIAAGLAARFQFSAMLAVLITGLVAVNAAPHRKRILEDLTAIDYPLYVLFFIMAGAALHFEYLGQMGLVGAAYVVLRGAGKYIGCRLGTRTARASTTIKTWLGPAMLAQAGLAIGLADALARDWPGTGRTLQTVILAAVVIFEVVGPLLTRIALVRAGEVTVLKLLAQRSPMGYGEGMQQVFNQLRNALGITGAGARQPREILVGHIMRRNVDAVPNHASFDEVLKTLGRSRYDRLPVVNDRHELVGVIKYADIANTLFDPGLCDLVVAAEIATEPFLRLTPEDTLEEAMTAVRDHPYDAYLLVVESANPKKLAGIVRHNDLLSARRCRPG